MAARFVRRDIYLALDTIQLGLSAVFCVIEWVSADCLLASWCFLVHIVQVQTYKGKHCSLVGIQYVYIKTRGI